MPGEEMDDQFREIRKGERDQVLGFAKERGCDIEPMTLRHHLSLAVYRDGQQVAAGLCVETQPTQFVIEVVNQDGVDQALIAELADRCLRKVQAVGISSARLHSPSDISTQTIWDQANWLDRIEETPPIAETQAA